MDSNTLVDLGNQRRNEDQYHEALRYYAQSFIEDPENINAWNNYGNVLREIGEPMRAIPFLEHACVIKPDFVTGHFNQAVALLLAGEYARGWEKYEWRWQYEHLANSKPVFNAPEWQGESLEGKTILVYAEQGFGDVIQFSRFLYDLHIRGAEILFVCMTGLVPLFQPSYAIKQCTSDLDALSKFDCWIPIMSLPRVLKVTKDSLRHDLCYIQSQTEYINKWTTLLGSKTKMRIGICWSGRRDNWVNRYKGVPVSYFVDLIKSNPQHEWINLQAEALEDEQQKLNAVPIRSFPGAVQSWADTAGLVHHLDLVISIDTSIAHLAGAMGKPTWIPLTKFAVDWRWGLGIDQTPWYPSARLFRQPDFGDWGSVFAKLDKFLSQFKL